MRDRDGVEWLTVAEVVDRLHINKATIYAWIKRGLINTIDTARPTIVSMPDILRAEQAWRRRTKGHRRRAEVTPLSFDRRVE